MRTKHSIFRPIVCPPVRRSAAIRILKTDLNVSRTSLIEIDFLIFFKFGFSILTIVFWSIKTSTIRIWDVVNRAKFKSSVFQNSYRFITSELLCRVCATQRKIRLFPWTISSISSYLCIDIRNLSNNLISAIPRVFLQMFDHYATRKRKTYFPMEYFFVSFFLSTR